MEGVWPGSKRTLWGRAGSGRTGSNRSRERWNGHGSAQRLFWEWTGDGIRQGSDLGSDTGGRLWSHRGIPGADAGLERGGGGGDDLGWATPGGDGVLLFRGSLL